MNIKLESHFKINDDQKNFIHDTILTSFPQIKLIIEKDCIKITNFKKNEILHIKKSVKSALFVSRGIQKRKIIFKQNNSIRFDKDPLNILRKKKEVVNISSNLYQFQGQFLKIFRGCNKYFFDLAIKKYKAIDQENPLLWPIDLYKKINYLSEFPQQSLFMVGIKKNFRNYNDFSKKYSKNKKYKTVKIEKKFFKESEYGLQPAVCDNCYYALSNTTDLKDTVYTTYNKVFRDEKSKKNTLDRLMSFSVRDIMFVGTKDFVLKIRQKLIEDIIKFLKITNLNCSIEVADDPFFTGKANKKLFQHLFELKYEILAYIPFLKKKIAIGSINYHLDTFGDAFNIKSHKKKKEKMYSGCIGIGFERLILALYSQHGTDIRHWPNKFKKKLKLN